MVWELAEVDACDLESVVRESVTGAYLEDEEPLRSRLSSSAELMDPS